MRPLVATEVVKGEASVVLLAVALRSTLTLKTCMLTIRSKARRWHREQKVIVINFSK